MVNSKFDFEIKKKTILRDALDGLLYKITFIVPSSKITMSYFRLVRKEKLKRFLI